MRISPKRINGDFSAQNVLDCLIDITVIYGDQMILLQYMPYIWDMINMARKKLTTKLEGALLGTIELMHHLVPLLSDSVLMNELSDNIMVQILFPALQLSSSRNSNFNFGSKSRQNLIYKLLDVTYIIGLRIGEEMCRSNLSQFCTAFFSSFDKVYESKTLKVHEESQELSETWNPEVAFVAYAAFYNLLGRSHLHQNIVNLELVKRLCLLHQDQTNPEALHPRPIGFNNLRGFSEQQMHEESPGFGNKLLNVPKTTKFQMSHSNNSDASDQSFASMDNQVADLHSLIAKDINKENSARHLKGNWLAFWEHEIGRSQKDVDFNLKQIKLQNFNGHLSGVKALHVLDNENSFLSGSRDKTAKVWSLR